MIKIKSACVWIVALTAACHASTRESQDPEVIPGVNPTPEISPGNRTIWTITPTAQEHRYRSAVTTFLELPDSAGIKTDSVKTIVDFTLSVIRTPDLLSYTTTIESMSLQSSTGTGDTPARSSLPFSFTGQLQQGKLSIILPSKQPASLTDCSDEMLSLIPVVQRAVLQVPLLLRKDLTWTDSTSANVCAGSIPITSIASRRYRILGETGSGILIERQDKTTSTGEGTQGQHRVRLRSDGTGTVQLLVDSRTAALIESTGTHTASVVVTASGRDRIFRQTSREQISSH